MGRQWLASALLAMAGVLGGCGGGGGGGGGGDARVDGLLVGTATRSATERNAIAFASAGRLMAVEGAPNGFFFDADYTITDGTLSGSARTYSTSLGKSFVLGYTETATLTGTATEDGWAVTIAGPSVTTAFDLIHDGADTQDSSLAWVEGTWVFDPSGPDTSTLTIAGGGTTSSTNDSGCASNGAVAIIDQDFNLYGSATTVSDASGACPNSIEGAYTGLITLNDYAATGTDQLVVMLAKPEYFFLYAYTRQP